MVKEYIELKAAKEVLLSFMKEADREGVKPDQVRAIRYAVHELNKVPAADVVEVKHGQWVGSAFDFYCSACGAYQGFHVGRTKYCPKCGARMDGE